LFTDRLIEVPKVENGFAVSDTKRDILKLAVVNRYRDTKPAVGFVNNFGIKTGAIASSVAHDSHNIVAVGVSDEDICRVVNLIICNRGGIGAVSGSREMVLPLPIAGIMSDKDYVSVANRYIKLDGMAKSMGSKLRAPFMTLSFMALLVIPGIKMSDKGLFDADKFRMMDVFC